tara:strand:- start:92 stop:334 length:243 start_codon:yes stop_codon:yes gene_type:complete
VKNYKAMKAASKWSIRKYGDKLQLLKKFYDSSTGTQGSDSIQDFTLTGIASDITRITNQITELTNEKADMVQLETDLKAL